MFLSFVCVNITRDPKGARPSSTLMYFVNDSWGGPFDLVLSRPCGVPTLSKSGKIPCLLARWLISSVGPSIGA
jgi:hypothetical protein